MFDARALDSQCDFTNNELWRKYRRPKLMRTVNKYRVCLRRTVRCYNEYKRKKLYWNAGIDPSGQAEVELQVRVGGEAAFLPKTS